MDDTIEFELEQPAGALQAGVRVHVQERDAGNASGPLVGRVLGADHTGVRVELLDLPYLGALRPGVDVRLTNTTDHGLFLANTVVRQRDDALLELDPPSSTRYVQRRRHRRVPVSLSLQCQRLGDHSAAVIAAEAVDLSRGGLQLMVPRGLESGDVVQLTVLDADDTVSYRGLVVDVRDLDDAGDRRCARVAFSGFTPAMEAALARLLARHAS